MKFLLSQQNVRKLKTTTQRCKNADSIKCKSKKFERELILQRQREGIYKVGTKKNAPKISIIASKRITNEQQPQRKLIINFLDEYTIFIANTVQKNFQF